MENGRMRPAFEREPRADHISTVAALRGGAAGTERGAPMTPAGWTLRVITLQPLLHHRCAPERQGGAASRPVISLGPMFWGNSRRCATSDGRFRHEQVLPQPPGGGPTPTSGGRRAARSARRASPVWHEPGLRLMGHNPPCGRPERTAGAQQTCADDSRPMLQRPVPGQPSTSAGEGPPGPARARWAQDQSRRDVPG
jgi:hypothetical protein